MIIAEIYHKSERVERQVFPDLYFAELYAEDIIFSEVDKKVTIKIYENNKLIKLFKN